MLVVDASCLYAALVGGRGRSAVEERLVIEQDQVAPHLVDVEVLDVIRRDRSRGLLDATAADQAVEDLRAWPGERYGHTLLLERAWELRGGLRAYDAIYVALAEAFDAPLVTLDARLGRAIGPRCQIEVLS